MIDISQYPGLEKLVASGANVIDVESRLIGTDTFLRVTEVLDSGEGDQLLVRQRDGVVSLVSQDNVVEFPAAFSDQFTVDAKRVVKATYQGTMTDAQHSAVAQMAKAKVDVYRTGTGPGGGSVACLWAMRHLVQEATGIMITH